MKKKTYKRIQNQLYRALKMRMILEEQVKEQKADLEITARKLDWYKNRVRSIGNNMETIDPDNGKAVRLVKWELEPEFVGNYAIFDPIIHRYVPDMSELIEERKEDIVRKLVKELMDNEMVQFFVTSYEDYGPLNRYATLAAKMYVVPWEQMPHRRTIELKQYMEDRQYD